jgi:hypothetical protein
MKFHPLIGVVLTALPLDAAEKRAPKPIVDPPRAELEKLGGFEPAPGDPPVLVIHCELQVVAVPEADALPLVEQMKDPAQIERGYEAIQVMLARKKATLIGWPCVITKSGQRAVAENVTEIRYATEFLPAPDGARNAAPVAGHGAPPGDARPAAANAKAEVAAENPPHGAGAAVKVPEVFPSAFEKRDTGVTLELEPTLSELEPLRIDIQIVPQHVRLLRFEQRVTETQGRKVIVEQPVFETNKVSTNICISSGQRVLLGTFRVTEPPGCIELFIFKATAKPVSAAPAARPALKNRGR